MLGWVNLWKEKLGCFLSWAHQNILSPNWEKIEVKKQMPTKAEFGEIIQSSGEPRHLSTILFKKKKFSLAILNKCESFSGMVDYITCPP